MATLKGEAGAEKASGSVKAKGGPVKDGDEPRSPQRSPPKTRRTKAAASGELESSGSLIGVGNRVSDPRPRTGALIPGASVAAAALDVPVAMLSPWPAGLPLQAGMAQGFLGSDAMWGMGLLEHGSATPPLDLLQQVGAQRSCPGTKSWMTSEHATHTEQDLSWVLARRPATCGGLVLDNCRCIAENTAGSL